MSFPKKINHSQAVTLILQQVENKKVTNEFLSLDCSLGRVLAGPVTAPVDVPAFECSRMDGYAINLNILQSRQQASGYVLSLGDAIHATAQSQTVLCKNKAIPIMTGGMLPVDANAIVLKEQAIIENNELSFTELPKEGEYIRTAGSDLQKNQAVVESFQRLNSAHLGLLASLGLSKVKVLKQPHVVLMMTGDELVKPGMSCLPGQIYDANTTMLSALLTDMGCKVTVLDTLLDTKEAVSKRMASIKKMKCDVVISVGGVSMGDKDWIPLVLQEQGEVLFHKVQIKPGFPMLFGRLKNALFYGLPGNPVSAYSTLCQYVFPVIQKLKKQCSKKITWHATLCHDLPKTHSRCEFFRGYYERISDMAEGNQIQVTICGGQQSSRIESLADANCFVVLDEAQYDLKAGSRVNIQPFMQFGS